MAPFNMRCKTCGEYIYRGKKFNAKKEDVIGKMFLGIQIYRFYIKCTKCLAEITFLVSILCSFCDNAKPKRFFRQKLNFIPGKI